MLYLMMFFMVCFLFHMYRSNKFEKEHEDLYPREIKTQQKSAERDIFL